MAVLSMPKQRLAVVVLGVLLALVLIRFVTLRNDHFCPNSLPYNFPTAVDWRNRNPFLPWRWELIVTAQKGHSMPAST